MSQHKMMSSVPSSEILSVTVAVKFGKRSALLVLYGQAAPEQALIRRCSALFFSFVFSYSFCLLLFLFSPSCNLISKTRERGFQTQAFLSKCKNGHQIIKLDSLKAGMAVCTYPHPHTCMSAQRLSGAGLRRLAVRYCSKQQRH